MISVKSKKNEWTRYWVYLFQRNEEFISGVKMCFTAYAISAYLLLLCKSHATVRNVDHVECYKKKGDVVSKRISFYKLN